MATYNPGESRGTARTQNKSSRDGSMQSTSSPPKSSAIGHARTEYPKEPESISHGNQQLELSLKLLGQLGHFLPRNQAAHKLTYLELSPLQFRDATRLTLYSVLKRLLKIKGYVKDDDIEARAIETSTTLANGTCVMTYLKLRAVNSLDYTQMRKFLKKPKVPQPFEVPSPFALAISQLGVVHASGLVDEKMFSPTLSAADGNNSCLPIGVTWSPTRYAQAVEYAKSIGMQFTIVDLQVKLGSTWWLYAQDYVDDVFSLRCPLPESNFTEATTILHTLFCINAAGEAYNPFFALGDIEDKNFGTMLCNPPADINVTSYFVVEETPESLWNVV